MDHEGSCVDLLSVLPMDVQRKLFVQYLGPEATAKMRTLSLGFLQICSSDDIWRDFCCMELSMKPRDLGNECRYVVESQSSAFSDASVGVKNVWIRSSPFSYYDLFTRLIYPFQGLLNRILTSDTSVHGEILTISYESGLIRGDLWFAPSDTTRTMKPLLEFTVFVEESSNHLMILNEFDDPYVPRNVQSFGSNWLKDLIFCQRKKNIRDCLNSSSILSVRFAFRSRSGVPRLRRKLLESVVKDDLSFPKSARELQIIPHAVPIMRDQATELGVHTFFNIGVNGSRSWDGTVFTPLPEFRADPLLTALALPQGLFQGIYGSHGTEVIRIWTRYDEDEQLPTIVGTKITGDPNIPAGKISFQFSLRSAVLLQADQQHDLQFLQGLLDGPFVPIDNMTNLRQIFRVPAELRIREPLERIPKECHARFVGHGSVAGHGYEDPESIVAHFVVFSPDRFMALWLDLRCATMFEKITVNDTFEFNSYNITPETWV